MQEKLENSTSLPTDQSFIPPRQWFSLGEACLLKGLNYKTACNRTYLQPNGGKAEMKIGGRKKFSRSTILQWLLLPDDELKSIQDRDTCL